MPVDIALNFLQKPSKPVNNANTKSPKLWMPGRVLFTPEALEEKFGQQVYERIEKLALPIEILKNNRLTGLRGATEKETYKLAKTTLAIVKAPPGAFKLSPIPPSADWQFHLAQGCPAHCQYCYLAGSLSGPPAIRVFANLPSILQNLINYQDANKLTTFEASCYTDPLSIEHLTGSLSESIKFFSHLSNSQLRVVSKFDAVDSLLAIDHYNKTRFRVSLNAEPLSRKLEGGTAAVKERISALRKLALPKSNGGGAYPVGIVIAPIMPFPDWELHYKQLLDEVQQTLDFPVDLTFELITHRFTPGSKQVLQEWYPNTGLEMEESTRSEKRNKFGGVKYVYTTEVMKMMKSFFYKEIKERFAETPILYWT